MAAAAVLLPATTPADYHRIVSPTLKVPTEPTISIPVGLLACQRDPLLRTLETTIVSASVVQPPPPNAAKKGKKAVVAPDLPNEPILHVLLHDTVIFPEGGGQPTDTGLIIITANGAPVPWVVVQCKRHGGHAVHYVKIPKESTADEALLSLQNGVKVTVSLGQNDYDRRYDHMSMHTSQHLLSALLESNLNLPTLSWSLTSYPSPCYVEIPRGMSVEEITTVQTEANQLVFEGRRVHVEVAELDDVQEKSKVQPVTDAGRAVGKALPTDYTGGVKRVVVIDGVDRNPCCGTHLPSLYNLQLFIIPHTEALSRSSTTSARLYFLCGPRLITYLTSTHNLLTSTSTILSCGVPLVPDRVAQVVEERKRVDKRATDVEQELARMIAKKIYTKVAEAQGGLYKQHFHRTDDTNNVLGFLTAIAFSVNELLAEKAKDHSYLIILSSSSSNQNQTSTSTVMIVSSDEAKVKAAADILKAKLSVKGGGKGLKWSGKFIGVWKESRESAAIDDILKAF
ncbi:alanyl-tRNA synthetase domain-containing protein [Crepidotus variabilis]|uniref:Alanyl-tRNA synthetase domain-containing protein n=1 Tax=Crepidotus variabilis TaxID=179855 RepID=A0A9P6EU22_9AGAR|nr:alanyl-tRNA synthetase domain-containing protein [Crepidotus variabilis]